MLLHILPSRDNPTTETVPAANVNSVRGQACSGDAERRGEGLCGSWGGAGLREPAQGKPSEEGPPSGADQGTAQGQPQARTGPHPHTADC